MTHRESSAHAEDDLEAVLLELAFEFVDFTVSSFEAAVQAAADQVDGEILFNVRFDHPRYQRVAAVRNRSQEQDKVCLILFERSGHRVRVIPIAPDHAPTIEEVRAWSAQPLHLQADAENQDRLKHLLFVACAPLRRAG
jgi:hypothetical protein